MRLTATVFCLYVCVCVCVRSFSLPQVVYIRRGKPCVGNQLKGGRMRFAVQTQSQDVVHVHNNAVTSEKKTFLFFSLRFGSSSTVSWDFPLSTTEDKKNMLSEVEEIGKSSRFRVDCENKFSEIADLSHTNPTCCAFPQC